ncbi:hypothetical protein IV102_22830 [bacterium]|nr:hypothetical protein [bacterium]
MCLLRALRHFHATTLSGLHRMPKDCFALFGRRLDQPDLGWRRLAQPWSSYRADPFLLEWQGQFWLFFEEFEYLRNKGRLAACRLDGSAYTVVMDRPYHMSYPFPLLYQDRLWMVPESCQNGTVDLYESVTFPHGWRLVRSLLQAMDAVDATLLWENERWWLFTSVRPPGVGQRHLEIYSSPDLLTGDWLAHPINEQRLYHSLSNQSGRCGGAFFRHQGQWIRPAQYSPAYYGQGLAFRELRKLSLEHFAEVGVDIPDLPWRQNHHLTTLGVHQWVNRKVRVSYTARPRALQEPWSGS